VPPPRGIPPKYEELVLEKSGEGQSTRTIAAWLKSEHGVQTTHKTVAVFLAGKRAERSKVTKAIVQEKLGKTVTLDIDRLEECAVELHKMARRVLSRVDDPERSPLAAPPEELYLKVVEQLRKLTDTKLHYSGADAPEDAFSGLADLLAKGFDHDARGDGESPSRAVE
jgi:hypothetical protein